MKVDAAGGGFVVVNEEMGVYTTGTIAVLFTSGHERVSRVSVVGGCTVYSHPWGRRNGIRHLLCHD